jgi:SAM-dependent methyltransferase
LAQRSPHARFISVDRSQESLAAARRLIESARITNVEFQHGDLFALPYPEATFDHVFVCFVLEHLSQPADALLALKKLLKPGGTMTVIEGDHDSAYFHPDSAAAREAIDCLIKLQAQAGGNSLIGRQLYPLLAQAGFNDVRVTERPVYVDGSRPDLIDGFTRKTFTAMIEGVREPAVAARLITAERFDEGIRDLNRTAAPDGVFCYAFFKGLGVR